MIPAPHTGKPPAAAWHGGAPCGWCWRAMMSRRLVMTLRRSLPGVRHQPPSAPTQRSGWGRRCWPRPAAAPPAPAPWRPAGPGRAAGRRAGHPAAPVRRHATSRPARRPAGRPAPATPSSSSDEAALPPGGLLYAATTAATGTPTWDIWVANPDGTGRRDLTRDAAEDADPAWSPDRRRIVYASTPARCRGSACQSDLYAIGRDGRHRLRLTSTPQEERESAWSPDGTRIAYTRSDAGHSTVWVMRADGGGQRRLTDDPGFAPDWAPDGRRLLYLRMARNGGNPGLYTIHADGSARRRVGDAHVWARSARWSPDGTRIALSKQDAIWVVNADGSGLRRIRQSAADPWWTPDGRHLLFTAYAAAPTGEPELRRIDLDGRNEVVLGRDQPDSTP
jgi:dipeptidyl aminopeptidase/acylaminoacyl peptidase